MNQLYNDCRERMLKATLDWAAMTCVLLAYSDITYVFDPNDLTQADIGVPDAVSGVLIQPIVVAGGYARTGAGIFTAIPEGPDIWFLVLAQDNVVPANRRLLAYIDTAQNMPFTPNGLDWVATPDWASSQGWWRA